MPNPYEFCATACGSAFLASELVEPSEILPQSSAVADEAPCLHHTSLRPRAKSSEIRAILLLIANVSGHLWPGWG
jgi:hypothetical protein